MCAKVVGQSYEIPCHHETSQNRPSGYNIGLQHFCQGDTVRSLLTDERPAKVLVNPEVPFSSLCDRAGRFAEESFDFGHGK